MNERQISDLKKSLSDMERIASTETGPRQADAEQRAASIRKLLAEFAAREEQENNHVQ